MCRKLLVLKKDYIFVFETGLSISSLLFYLKHRKQIGLKVFKTSFTLFFLFTSLVSFSQKEVTYRLYLIGDTGAPVLEGNDPVLSFLKKEIDKESKKSAIVYLGDNIYHNGMPPKDDPKRGIAESKLNIQLDNLKDFRGEIYFIPGNHDWNDAKKGGLSYIKAQEKYIEKYLDNGDIMIPDKGCPGPEIKKLGKDVVLFAMDSQWWLHPHEDMESFEKCNNISTTEIIQELKDRLDQYEDRFVVIAFHHPLYTNGSHNGHYTFKQMLFPLTDLNKKMFIPLPGLGFLYPFYRSAFGAKQDLPHPLYQSFKAEILEALKGYNNVIIASGHEHAQQYFKRGENHYVVSGSGSKTSLLRNDKNALYSSEEKGFSRVTFYKDGSADLEFIEIDQQGASIPFAKEIISKTIGLPSKTAPYELSTATKRDRASSIYNTSKLHQTFFGKTYRKDWNTEVEVKNLNLSTEHGGLVPIKKGGGFSSNSLRLRAPDKKQYVLRSVQKGVVKVVPPAFRGTFVQNIFQDQIAASQPYAALAVPPLAKVANVYHTHPEIVYVEEQKALGQFNETFGNALYLYEERPAGKWEHEDSEDDPKKIVGYNDVLKALIKSDKARIDQKQVLRSRIFDLFLGDWDRHDDQWRWARNKVEKDGKELNYYEPFPRDRDQVFFGYKGFIPAITKVLSPELRKFVYFDDEIKNVKYLGFNARHFDRHFTNQMDKNDWVEIANELQNNITNDAIEESIASLPLAIQNLRGEAYKRKLKNRRADLPEYAKELYHEVAKYVNVPGTNKKDRYEVIRNQDNSTDVTVFDLNNEGEKTRVTYKRKFMAEETKEIRLYALDGKDQIQISGEQSMGPLVRVISGKGEDQVIDDSKVGGARKKTKVYDSSLSESSSLGKEAKFIPIKNTREHDFDRKEFDYDATISVPLVGYNPDDGLVISHLLSSKKYKWRKKPFGEQHTLTSRYAFASSEFSVHYFGEYIRLFGNADLLLEMSASIPSDRENFFGLSNDRAFSFIDDEDFDLYRYSQNRIIVRPSLQWASPFRIHKITIGPQYEFANLEENEGNFIREAPFFESERESHHFLGLGMTYSLSQMNDLVFPSKGVDFSFETRFVSDIGSSSNDLFQINGSLSVYNFIPLPKGIVWATRIGGGINYGDYSFFQAQFLGRGDLLRGYRNRRIGGRSSFVWSNDLRIKMWKVPNKIIPFSFGIIASYDNGRVWNKNEVSAEGWHQSYGGGFWISPYDISTISFYFMKAASNETDFNESTFSFQAGFPF